MNELTGLSMMKTLRTSLVTTISNEMNVGSKGILNHRNFTLGNSITVTQLPQIPIFRVEPSLNRILSTDDFWKNMAFSVKYENELEKEELSYGLHISKTANGYVNPGNTLLNSGAKELGVSIRKLFLKSKRKHLYEAIYESIITVREKDRIWRIFMVSLDVKWKLKKDNLSVYVIYPNKMSRIEEGKKSMVILC